MKRRELREAVLQMLFETEFRKDETPEEIFVISAENREYSPEDQNEIQSRFLDASLGKCGKRNGDHHNAAQKQGELMQADTRVLSAEAQEDDAKQFNGVQKDCGNNQNARNGNDRYEIFRAHGRKPCNKAKHVIGKHGKQKHHGQQ